MVEKIIYSQSVWVAIVNYGEDVHILMWFISEERAKPVN